MFTPFRPLGEFSMRERVNFGMGLWDWVTWLAA